MLFLISAITRFKEKMQRSGYKVIQVTDWQPIKAGINFSPENSESCMWGLL